MKKQILSPITLARALPVGYLVVPFIDKSICVIDTFDWNIKSFKNLEVFTSEFGFLKPEHKITKPHIKEAIISFFKEVNNAALDEDNMFFIGIEV